MAFDIDSKPGYAVSQPRDVSAAERVRAGKAPEPAAKSDAELGIDEGVRVAPKPGIVQRAANAAQRAAGAVESITPPIDTSLADPNKPYNRREAENPVTNDPIAQAVLAAPLAAGGAALVGPAALELGAAPLIARAIGGAAGGAIGSGVTGQDPVTGAAIGAGVPLAGAGVAAVGSAIGKALAPWGQAAARRVSERVVTEWGQAAAGAGKSKVQSSLMRIDPEKAAATLEANGISLSGQSAAEAQAAQRAALARTGKELGAARDVVDAADPARKTVGDAMKAVQEQIDALRTGPKANVPLADAMHGWSKDYLQAQGGAPGAPVSVSDLSKTISALEEKGYGGMGAKLPPGDAKKAARLIAGALDDVMDDHIGTVAAKNPAAAQAAKEIAAKTAEFRVLKTVQPIVDQRAVAERFAPTAVQRFAAAPGKAVKNAAAAVVTAPVRAVAAVPGAVDTMMARLFAARAAGGVTPDLLQAAEKAGVAAPALQFFARPAEQRR
jgi:hypothetical protein